MYVTYYENNSKKCIIFHLFMQNIPYETFFEISKKLIKEKMIS